MQENFKHVQFSGENVKLVSVVPPPPLVDDVKKGECPCGKFGQPWVWR